MKPYLCKFVVIPANYTFIRATVKILAVLFGLLLQLDLTAQNRHERLIPPGDSVVLGSFLIVAESLEFSSLDGNPQKPTYSLVGGERSYIIFNPPLKDTLKLSFQSISLQIPKTYSLKDTGMILPLDSRFSDLEKDKLYSLQGKRKFQPFQALNSQGSLSRSIAVGNNQDAVLNSALNLQLSGNLGPKTRIRASISDNTVPVQAEGYTQQLRDFDRVYLEIENPDFGLIRGGDYNISPRQSTFLNFEKRISGGGLQTNFKTSSSASGASVQLEGGLARGRFARNRFQGEEGNQGPYKLTGANGEQFIIIISGSERVYIDGILLTRGQQYDYVIDYNAGELSFTALQPITRDKRIVVEFQYTEQNYLRSVAYGEGQFNSENWQSRVQYYSEQDSKGQPLGADLSDSEKAILSEVGDQIDQAFASTIVRSEFNPALVQYRLVDSLGFDSVLVFSTDSSEQMYNASFAFVGHGAGDYRLISSNANGRVFEWLAPENGLSRGSYAPLKTLVAPNRLQVLNFNSAGKFGKGKNQSLDLDIAASNNQVNLFSTRDLSNDDGVAGKLGYRWKPKLKRAKFELAAAYQFNNPGFSTVERVFAVEFARDWNLPLNYQGPLQNAVLDLKLKLDSVLLRSQTQILNSPLKEGWRQTLALAWQDSLWIGSVKTSITETEGLLLRERFWREQLETRYYLKPNIWLGLKSIGEWNRKEISRDSLAANSYSFLEYQVFQGFGDTNSTFLELGFLQRYDDSVRISDLQPFTYAYTFFGRSSWRTKQNGRLQVATYYRNLQVLQPEELSLQRSLTTRINFQQPFFDRALRWQSFYESGAGTEPRRSFTFIEVPAGTGTHTHIDYNGNGIRELDEFEIAPTPDLATFVRVFSPNLEFLRTSSVKLGQTLNIQAPNSWLSEKEGYKVWLQKFSMVSSYQLEQRTLLEGGLNELNPFRELESDTLLVAESNAFRQTLFFNRSLLGFGGEYSFNRSAGRNLLSFGIEERALDAHRLGLRYGFDENFILRLQAMREDKRNRSGNFQSRNFDLGRWTQDFSLTFQQAEKLSLTGAFQYRDEQSQGANENALQAQEYRMEVNYNLAKSIALQSELAYIRNNFEGDVNSPSAFEMLQAFKPGDNLSLTVTLQRTFLKNIVISLNYAGRFSRESFAIHTGNFQVKAFL